MTSQTKPDARLSTPVDPKKDQVEEITPDPARDVGKGRPRDRRADRTVEVASFMSALGGKRTSEFCSGMSACDP